MPEVMTTPKDCRTCLYMATHEPCDKDGGCLNTPEDWAQYRAGGVMPPFRYRWWEEAPSPMAQMERLHGLQKSGARSIVLGPGEAEVNARQTPQEASAELHRVAEECGYMVGNLSHDKGDGKRSLLVCKDWGPFRIEWEGGALARVVVCPEGKPESVYWDAAKAW